MSTSVRPVALAVLLAAELTAPLTSVCVSPAADSNVLLYLSDAVAQLLDHKEEYTQFGVIRYFAE